DEGGGRGRRLPGFGGAPAGPRQPHRLPVRAVRRRARPRPRCRWPGRLAGGRAGRVEPGGVGRRLPGVAGGTPAAGGPVLRRVPWPGRGAGRRDRVARGAGGRRAVPGPGGPGLPGLRRVLRPGRAPRSVTSVPIHAWAVCGGSITPPWLTDPANRPAPPRPGYSPRFAT